MVFKVSAYVYGLGGVLAVGGLALIALGYNLTPNNLNEVNIGEWLIGIAVVMWIIGVILRESKKGGAFHNWH